MTHADLYVRMPSCSSAPAPPQPPTPPPPPPVPLLPFNKKRLKKESSQAGTLGQYMLTFPTESRNKATEKRTWAYIMAGRAQGVSSWMTPRCEKILRGVWGGWEWREVGMGHSKTPSKKKKKESGGSSHNVRLCSSPQSFIKTLKRRVGISHTNQFLSALPPKTSSSVSDVPALGICVVRVLSG